MAITNAPAITRCSCSTSSGSRTLRPAAWQCSQRRRLGERAEAGRARYRGNLAYLFPRRRGFAIRRSTRTLRAKGSNTRSGSPQIASCTSGSAICSSVPSAAPPLMSAVPMRTSRIKRKLDEGAPRRRQGRVAFGRTLPARRLHRHQHGSPRRERRRSTTNAAREQWIKEGKGAVNGRLSCRSFAATAVRLQLHALAHNLRRQLPAVAHWRRPSRSKV